MYILLLIDAHALILATVLAENVIIQHGVKKKPCNAEKVKGCAKLC